MPDGRRLWPFGRRDKEIVVDEPDEQLLLERIQLLESRLEEVSARADRLASILLRLVKLTVPPLVVALLVLVTWLAWPERLDRAVARMVTGALVGKIAVAGVQTDVLYWLVLMGTLDVMIGLFFLWNVDAIYRVPWVGDRFREMERLGRRFLLQADWLRRTAFLGVSIFIAVPVQGTGPITGSILGRFMGLGSTRTFLALVLGGYGGVALVLSGTGIAVSLRDVDPFLMAAFLTIVALLLLGFWWRYIRKVQARAPRRPE